MTLRTTNGVWWQTVLWLLYCCLLFVVPNEVVAQNLVPNGSFEVHDTCRAVLGFYSDADGPLGWFSASGSPDYYQGCVPNGSANGIPQSVYTFQYPQHGECFVGLVTYQLPTGLREYIMAQLLQPLVVGETYYISFYVSAAWNGTESNPQHYVATSNTGALFSMQPRPWAIGDSWPVPNNIAHVYHPWVIADTMNWILVSGSFVADSAYQYVMLGNHFNNALTDTLHFANGTSLPKAYTIIDNVCVSTDPSGCPLAMGEPVIEQPILANLYPNPAQDVLTLRTIGMDEEVWVIDALGRVIWQSLSGNELLSIDVSGWSRGAYILRVQQSGGIRLFNFMLIE